LLDRAESTRARERWLFDLEVKSAFASGKGHYGRDRVRLELGLRGRKACRKRIDASMERQGLRYKARRRFRVTTDSKHDLPVAQNPLNRNFSVSAPNQVLVSDITYLPSRCGWLYLTVFIDLFYRIVVGWCVSTSLSHEGVPEALYRAIRRRRAYDPFRPWRAILLCTVSKSFCNASFCPVHGTKKMDAWSVHFLSAYCVQSYRRRFIPLSI
jgi:putative transposase